MIDAVNSQNYAVETEAKRVNAVGEPRFKLQKWLLSSVLACFVLAGLGWAGRREFRSQKYALKMMREAVEASTAPGEMVVVDDRLLGWALRRGSDGVLRQSVVSVAETGSAASLLAKLRETNRREMVVVATPDDGLVKSLDAAGFTVAQEVGWVPWDVSGRGRSLLGRGRKRIYFAVAPQIGGTPVVVPQQYH
jgi:hypothetical protein